MVDYFDIFDYMDDEDFEALKKALLSHTHWPTDIDYKGEWQKELDRARKEEDEAREERDEEDKQDEEIY